MKILQDPLTGLLARQSFMAVASGRLRSEDLPLRRLAIIEVVGLSIINETQGLAFGDQILREVAFWLASNFDPDQSVLGRWDGSKFVVLYEACVAEVFLAKVHRASLGSIGLGVDLGGQAAMVRLHVGLCDSYSLWIDDLLTFANEALREADRSLAVSSYRFDEAMHRRLLRRQDIEKDLAFAIDSRAIGLWYQPIFSGDGRRIRSIEALLRWYHPRQGWTSPEEVIHAANLMGMGEALLQHILQEVCRGLHSLSDADERFEKVPVAMNVSPREIANLSLREVLLPALWREGFAAERLRVEITEESALDSLNTSGQLEALSDAGIGIAVDDFGRGYSSLAMLDERYVSQVKIDRTLIAGIHKSDRRKLLVSSIIHLGGALGLEVVGEGVETAEEYNHLRSIGCPLVQGYYLARPSPLDSLIAEVGRERLGLG
jgi:EAL domain-containing protein (putative c-di-GMP-specific phosphodiesterase class I)